MYYNKIHNTLATTGSWNEVSTISPLAFTMAMEVITDDYMDDMLTLISTVPCPKHLLEKLHDIITWSQMKLKHGKSRFYINESPILIVSNQPIKIDNVRSLHASNC